MPTPQHPIGSGRLRARPVFTRSSTYPRLALGASLAAIEA